jgi:4-hydroxybenzoate polyprenyltransferase
LFLIRFLLYSNIYIALAALALSLQTILLLKGEANLFLLGEIFSASLAVYALHRLVGLHKLGKMPLDERFSQIFRQKKSILILFILSAIASGILFFYLQSETQIALIIAALPAFAYVVPLLQGKRLRDISYLKIFLVASVWASVTVILPCLEMGFFFSPLLLMLFVERAIFIFAITLPFDIRDMEIERMLAVKTIPERIGVQKTIYLSCSLLFIWTLLVYFIYPVLLAMIFSGLALLTALLVIACRRAQPDYHYTAFLDGTMLLQGILAAMYFLIF